MFWSKLHVYTLIPTMILYIVLAVVFKIVFKNKSDKARMIPIQVVTIILLGLEIAKQIYGFVKGYDLYWIPLHFCSLFIFIMPFAAFYNGKYKNTARMLGGVISTCLFLFMTVYPELIYGGDCIQASIDYILGKGGRFIELHSTLFHMIAYSLFFMYISLDVVEYNTKKDLIVVIIAFAIYCLVVAPFAHIIDTNFNNFCRCNAPFLEDVRLKLVESMSWGGQLIYVLMISVGTIIVPILAYLLLRGIDKLIHKFAK